MVTFVTDLTTFVKPFCYQHGKRLTGEVATILAGMATKKHDKPPWTIQITAWFKHLKLRDAEIAAKLGVNRETVWRWRKEPWRLDPIKLQRLAAAMGKKPQELWYPPGRESIDAMLDDADEEDQKTAADIVRRLVKK